MERTGALSLTLPEDLSCNRHRPKVIRTPLRSFGIRENHRLTRGFSPPSLTEDGEFASVSAYGICVREYRTYFGTYARRHQLMESGRVVVTSPIRGIKTFVSFAQVSPIHLDGSQCVVVPAP